jgi:hypothetical protein
MIAKVIVVIGTNASWPWDQDRIGTAVGRSHQRGTSQSQVSVIIILQNNDSLENEVLAWRSLSYVK